MTTIAPVSGPHTHTPASVTSVMGNVILALLPATLFGIYLFGWPAFNLFLLTILSAVLAEALCLWLADKPLLPFLGDGSAILTGWLLAMTLPPWAPWWIGVVGGAFAIIIGKQIFGGIGQNLFNPAMLARVMLLVSFPLEMTTWATPSPLFSASAPGFVSGLAITFGGGESIDALTSATVLGHIKTELTRGVGLSASLPDHYTLQSAISGFTNGSLGETSAVLLFVGGLYLLFRRIISWHIPLAMIAAVTLLSSVFYLLDAERYAPPSVHLLSGGLMLGALFIATDPVTSPNTRRGQLLFGAGCGTLIYIIRTWGGFPEGVGFAVLLMNAVTPLIDHYIRPRIYGRDRRGDPKGYPSAVATSSTDKRRDG